jgi:hypothetical protein
MGKRQSYENCLIVWLLHGAVIIMIYELYRGLSILVSELYSGMSMDVTLHMTILATVTNLFVWILNGGVVIKHSKIALLIFELFVYFFSDKTRQHHPGRGCHQECGQSSEMEGKYTHTNIHVGISF